MTPSSRSHKDALTARLDAAPVVPLVQSNDPDEALRISEALIEGGLSVLEVVLRTDRALACVRAIADAFPNAEVGAGTVLDADQAGRALDHGAGFLVSPGLDDGVVEAARSAGVPILPGIATATELQRAWNMGLRTVKFFPAGLSGGPAMLKALSSVFGGVRFMPTGGVSADNLSDYLAIPAVLACGGSWLTPLASIEAGDYQTITELAREARAIAERR
ncbi:MAG: bifunctional 4-hydroxy-2-oxoglutarate aldolase/2-dehydro-3-deoxy-phosphogluconate aldolase [Litorimonas sp.]